MLRYNPTDLMAILSSVVLAGSIALAQPTVAAKPVPPGAAALGYSRCVIDERPTVADIAPGRNGDYKWFSGQWYAGAGPSLDHYAMRDGVLVISLNGDLVSTARDFSGGKLPLLPGADGFYVEFDVQLSGNDPDHWPAVWLMPAEHSGKQEDHYEGDPAGFERWMELDVDEGGFGPGLTGTVHSWTGIWHGNPDYARVMNRNNVLKTPLDRSQKHSFGASYDPVKQRVTWWVDGVEQMSAEGECVPEIARKQHFYLIMGAQTHGAKKPYEMLVSGVRAFVPPTSVLPEVASAQAALRVDRILVLGNSITLHGVHEPYGWLNWCGMAASKPENDYVHRLVAAIDTRTGGHLRISHDNPPSLGADGSPVSGDANVVNVADLFERRYPTYTNARLQRQLDCKPDVVVLQFGENVPRDAFDPAAFKTALQALMAGLKASSNPRILVVSQLLGAGGQLDEIKQQVCAEDPSRRTYVDLSDFGKDPRNFASAEPYYKGIIVGHPGDKGMSVIADALLKALLAQ